jgi:hypothetical protein
MTARVLGLVLAAALLAGCGFKPQKWFESYVRLVVQEVGRSQQCHAAGAETRVELLDNADAVRAWQSARGVDLMAGRPLAEAPYAIVDVGARSTGGHGVAVSRSAVLRGDLLVLYATFISPGADQSAAQVLTSPCALVQLPPGRYNSVEIQDQDETVRATGARSAPQPAVPASPAQ